MKIGLLECDHVPEHFRSIAGDYRDMFGAWLPQAEFMFFDACNDHFPADDDDCDAYMCTGSKYSVYDDVDWILALKAFVKKIHAGKKKFVGVCFGHQMLGEALGGKVEKAKTGWNVGAHSFQILQHEPWMEPFQDHLHLLMMCQDQVLELPPGSTVLARTAACPRGHVPGRRPHAGYSGAPRIPERI